MVSEKEILKSYSYYKFMEPLDPRGGARLNTKGLTGRIYVRDHKTLLHTKSISCLPHGSREKDF